MQWKNKQMVRPKTSKRYPSPGNIIPSSQSSASLTGTHKRWAHLFSGKLEEIEDERYKTDEAIMATQNLFAHQFKRHMRRVEKVIAKQSLKEKIHVNTYTTIVSHVYTAIFLEQHFGLEIPDKIFMQRIKHPENFDALKALRLKKNKKIINAVKKLPPKKKHKK